MARHSERKRRRREAASFETLTAERMATTGHAVARATDGRVVLVRGAIVGERFEARWTRLRTAAQGELVKVLQASPMRRRPDCEYVDRCGGCDWMHIHDEAQLRLQQQSLEQLCQRAGLHPLPEVVAHRCGPPLRYRQRARISLRVNNGKVQLGYHRWRAHQLVNVSDCLVLAPALTQAFAGLRRALRGAAGEGEAALSLGTGGRVVVALRWQGELPAAAFAEVNKQVETAHWAGAQVWLGDAREPASFGDVRSHVTAHDGLPLVFPSEGFAQPSQYANTLLAQRVAALVAQAPATMLVELFAGCGTITVALIQHADEVVAVEQQAAAVSALRDNLRRRGLSIGTKVTDANAFKLPRPCHTVVLDPPRAGAAGAMRNIIEARAKHVVYLGCDAVTMARDARTLVDAGYRLTHLELMGTFPQTHHFETLMRLVRSNGQRGDLP